MIHISKSALFIKKKKKKKKKYPKIFIPHLPTSHCLNIFSFVDQVSINEGGIYYSEWLMNYQKRWVIYFYFLSGRVGIGQKHNCS